MIEITRIYIAINLILLSFTLIFHIVAISQDHWKIYEYRTNSNNTLFIGIFRRCENFNISLQPNIQTTYLICDDNKYCFRSNSKCSFLLPANSENIDKLDNMQKQCNQNHNPLNCDYSSIGKGLISCTIIAACFLGLALIFIFSHILIIEFKYKIHFIIAIISLILLFLGFLFLLITLILLGSTISYDLYQYRYNLDYRMYNTTATNLTNLIKTKANNDYDIRIDWSCGLEICALILSTFTLIIQIIYAISIRQLYIG